MIASITHSWIGQVHLLASIISLILGTLILYLTKGTNLHKQIGYVYTIAMLIVNITAFGIYRLFGGFGPFHITAIISLVSIIGGMLPIYYKSKISGWYFYHMAFMYYSVIGLYAAFLSEIVTRIPGLNFGIMVGVGTGLVMLVGVTFFQMKKNKWVTYFKK